MKIGSSETTREALDFHFSDYTKVKPNHIQKIDIHFLEWFIGFVEGDGSFIVGTPTAKKRKTISFCINQKDSKLMYKIKKKLGFGIVTTFVQNNETYHRYAVYGIQNITRLIHLFNGNLLLNKVNTRFQLWLTEYNTLYSATLSSHTLILHKPCQSTLSLDSAWLSGFTDAEGGFYASLTKQTNLKLQYRLRMKFYITQKYELEVLKNIVKLIHQNSNQSNDASNDASFNSVRYISNFKLDFYKLEISKHAYLLRTIAYFEKYQLKGKKHIVFNRWKRIYLNKDIVKKQASSSEKAFTRFKRLVSSVQNSDN
jgi:LAGLIDADG endonuclease